MTKWLLGALCAVAISTGIHAQTPAESQLPSALRDWRPWVLKDLDYRGCPFLAQSPANSPENFVCAWPGRLALASAASGATFSIRWRVEAPAWVPLPGDAEHWPQQVTVNGQRQPVLSRGEVPSLWLGVGTYEIAGRIPWREQPQTLIVPPSIGIVALTIDGKPVAPVQRDGEEITLGRAPAAAAAIEADNLDLRVYRRLADGIPAELETRLVFAVAGHPREETLGPVLPEGFAPTELVSAWPARLDGDGKLRVQVQPGSATVVLKARATAPLHDAVARVPAAPWPKQEIWSYEAAPRLRVTAASGAVQVDPRQAEAPGEWQALPAFALGNEAKLTIEERSRGLAPDEGNRLTLAREAWLEFGGGAWYARDRVSGTMAKGWRFDVAPPFSLEQAAAPSSTRGNEPLLVTRGAAPELSGVEWRTPSVDLAAGLHVAAAASMPVAGWQQTFDRVQATLHFPFGYKLLAAPGADSATGSWIAGWNLLDLFLCAIVALLAWRALGALGAAVVAAYLVLGYQEAGSPLWTLLAALAFALIARALPPGKLARAAEWLRRAALLALVLLTLPFVAREVRYALYPQLEEGGYAVYAQTAAQEEADFGGIANGYRQRYARVAPQARPVPEAPPAPPASMPMEAAQMQAAPKPMAKSELKAMRNAPAGANGAAGRVDIETANPVVQLADKIDHYSETTVVQTGRGAPSWTLGSTAWLSFSGPVLANQTVHLVIAPPWLVRPLRLLLAALLAWLVVRLVSGGAGGAALRRAAPA
ncbi:MAG TPA: hypothetical protein VFB32_14615, partial [Rudaea sp.]|nr:hypothetical protein [Rudaea sp.]